MGCMTPVTDGTRFSMQGPGATEFRKNIVESLMLNHPHDCPVCAEGGECHLQDMTMMVGHRNRSYRGRKNTHNNQDLGPLVHHEMNRCISCYRCTRFYNDYAGGKDLAAQAAHDHVYFGRHEDGTLESEFAGNLVEVCPTGVFTDKPLVNEYTRKWDLQSAPSICTGCALGCNISPGERYGKLKRIHNRYNSAVNGYFLCDRGRYGGNFVNDEQRAKFAGLRNANGSYDAIQSSVAIDHLKQWCASNKKVMAIGSPRASLETNYLLQKLVGQSNFSNGTADYEAPLITAIKNRLQNGSVSTPSMHQVEAADAVLILGEDVTNTAPRLALALRQSVRNLANKLATDMRIPLWQDEAVRNLAQDQLSPLFIAAMSDTPLDDVAEQTISLTPADLAHFGHAIAAAIDSSLPAHESSDPALVTRIADALKNAQRPLIVSGTGAQSLAVINAASAIAEALHKAKGNTNVMLNYCLPETNSMGLALLGESALSISDVCEQAANGNIDTLVVAENDLYRRAPSAQIDKLFNDVSNVVVLDCIDTPTLSQASLALPAASYIETEGTLVSSEGRAQRHYPVFQPAEQRQAAWRWLNQITADNFEHFDDVTHACAADNPAIADITKASPSAEFRDRGMKIPRQTHRYSGRTAMLADISVHEPKQPVDADTPLSFSMEGANSGKSGALIPFVWSPGWNSNQSIHKFQSEAGGTLAGGTPGVRLIEPNSSSTGVASTTTEQTPSSDEQFQLLPLYKIFGSEELSSHSPAIKEMTRTPFVQLCPDDAARLGLTKQSAVTAQVDGHELYFEVDISAAIPKGCAGYPVGLPDTAWLAPNSHTTLQKATAKLVLENGGSHV